MMTQFDLTYALWAIYLEGTLSWSTHHQLDVLICIIISRWWWCLIGYWNVNGTMTVLPQFIMRSRAGVVVEQATGFSLKPIIFTK